MYVLYQTNTLADKQSNESLVLLVNAACFPENHQMTFLSLLLDPTRYWTRGLRHSKRARNHYTTETVDTNKRKVVFSSTENTLGLFCVRVH